MFNAKQSALYVAVLGALIAAGEANGACIPGVRVNGILTCFNGQPNTLTCITQVSVAPDCTGPSPPGDCDFGNTPFNSGTSNLSSECSYTGASLHNPSEFISNNITNKKTKLASIPGSRVIPATTFKATGSGNGSSGPVGNPGQGPQKVKCVNGFLTGTGRRTPCVDFTDPNQPPVLKNGAGDPVTDISFFPPFMGLVCANNGTCKNTEEIFPQQDGNSLTCPIPPGGHAQDFTPTPPFIVEVDVVRDDPFDPSAEATPHFGCNGFNGNFYSCEGLPDFPSVFLFIGSGSCIGGTGDKTGTVYCETHQLPLGVLVCSGS
jgi:hypothetical protein